jgi:hypothetical protein
VPVSAAEHVTSGGGWASGNAGPPGCRHVRRPHAIAEPMKPMAYAPTYESTIDLRDDDAPVRVGW